MSSIFSLFLSKSPWCLFRICFSCDFMWYWIWPKAVRRHGLDWLLTCWIRLWFFASMEECVGRRWYSRGDSQCSRLQTAENPKRNDSLKPISTWRRFWRTDLPWKWQVNSFAGSKPCLTASLSVPKFISTNTAAFCSQSLAYATQLRTISSRILSVIQSHVSHDQLSLGEALKWGVLLPPGSSSSHCCIVR